VEEVPGSRGQIPEKIEEEIIKDRYLIQRITISKKFAFALLSLIATFMVLFLVKDLQFSEKLSVITIVSTQISIMVICVVYIRGQVLIDLKATATYGKRDPIRSYPMIPSSISMPSDLSGQTAPSSAMSTVIQGLGDLVKNIPPKG
jgi:hypothetical protein